jgi:hypothetical protein
LRYQFNYWLNTPDDNKILLANPAGGFYLHQQIEGDSPRDFDSIREDIRNEAEKRNLWCIQEVINLDTNRIFQGHYSTDFYAHERFMFERSGVMINLNKCISIVEHHGPDLAYRIEPPEFIEHDEWQKILGTEHNLFVAMMRQPESERDYSPLIYTTGDDRNGLIHARNAFLYGEHTFRMRYLKVQHDVKVHFDVPFFEKNYTLTAYARDGD